MAYEEWPDLPYTAWKDTCATLQLWTQVVGKVRLSLTPWINHSWHATLYVTARGLTTSAVPYQDRTFTMDFDFIDHALLIRDSGGGARSIALKPRSVADFYKAVMSALSELGLAVRINRKPNEIADAVPFDQDQIHRAYDADYAQKFWRILVASDRVFARFRSGFLGKVSPSHFFWGSFDLAITRFSGRRAPPHPGGVVNLPDTVAREAYSHEVSSAGFWPGNAAVPYPAYYAYAYPEPEGFRTVKVAPAEARFDSTLGEFLLPYDAVRTSKDPEATLLAFLDTTYAAAADRAKWDRAALECPLGVPGVPRAV